MKIKCNPKSEVLELLLHGPSKEQANEAAIMLLHF